MNGRPPLTISLYISGCGYESDDLDSGFLTAYYMARLVSVDSIINLFTNANNSHSLTSKFLPRSVYSNPGFNNLVEKAYADYIQNRYDGYHLNTEYIVKGRWAVSIHSHERLKYYKEVMVKQYDDDQNNLTLVFYVRMKISPRDGHDVIYLCFDFVEHEKLRLLRRLE